MSGIPGIGPENASINYTLGTWITGAPLVADADPTNLASVPANRQLQHPGSLHGSLQTNGAASAGLRTMSDGGTSCTVRAWFYDYVLLKWIPFGSVQTLTTAAANNVTFSIGSTTGTLWYIQLVSNTGVTALGYGFV